MLKLTTIVYEEAAATRKLLEDIELKQASSQYYGTLLNFLKSLCAEVLELTNNISMYLSSTSTPQNTTELRNWLILGSNILRQINNYCDSFEYAEVLFVPSATMLLLNKLFRAVTQHTAFMVRGSTEFNYTYKPIGEPLNDLAGNISTEIQKLDSSFAILIFPLAYGKNVMANCNLVHELGHLIVDSEELMDKFKSQLSNEKKRQVEDIIGRYARAGPQYDFESAQRKDRINGILWNWIHETMADFIGILLLGPCTLFAFMKLIESLEAHTLDDDEHPCNAIRIKMMMEILSQLKWDIVIQKESSQVWKRATEIGNAVRTSQVLYDAATECMPIIKKDIFEVVQQLCGAHSYKPEMFMAVRESIYGLLEQGIPPAEVMGNLNGDDKFETINPESVINGGWFFYEQNYPTWGQRYSKFNLTEKADFLNRLIAKAIEITFVEKERG